MAESHIFSEDEERRIIVAKYEAGYEKMKDQIDSWENPSNEIYHVTDRYGFIHDYRLPEKLSDYENKIRHVEASRSDKWVKMLKNWHKYYPSSDKLRQRIYKGIPNAIRGDAWCRLLGVSQVKNEQEGRYQEMLSFGLLNSPDIRQIDLDVNRTYRNNIMFRERYNNKQQELFRVLVAYSIYNSEIGYCQGMSQIAALILMYTSEEDAFWALDRLMSDQRHAMHGFFIPGFPKIVRFARHHDRILQRMLPKVYKHFKKCDIDSTLYTLKWFFQCFLDRVPFSLTLRLWDAFMLDGEVILTGMSYTLLKLHKKTILKKNMEDLIEFLQIELEKDFGYRDDQAIEALQLSIVELKKVKMDLPKEPAGEMEKPSKPFGIRILQGDSMSLKTVDRDDQSIAGSIIIKAESVSVSSAQTSRTSGSEADEVFDELDNIIVNESQTLEMQENVNAANKLEEILSECQAIRDSFTAKFHELESPRDIQSSLLPSPVTNISVENSNGDGISMQYINAEDKIQSKQYHQYHKSSHNNQQVEVKISSTCELLKLNEDEMTEKSGSRMLEEWPDSNYHIHNSGRSKFIERYRKIDNQEGGQDEVTSFIGSYSVVQKDGLIVESEQEVESLRRRTSIPKLVRSKGNQRGRKDFGKSNSSPTSPVYSLSPTSPTSPCSNSKQSFIPRYIPSSPPSRPSAACPQTSVDPGHGPKRMYSSNRSHSVDPEKLRIYVPYSVDDDRNRIRIRVNNTPTSTGAVNSEQNGSRSMQSNKFQMPAVDT